MPSDVCDYLVFLPTIAVDACVHAVSARGIRFRALAAVSRSNSFPHRAMSKEKAKSPVLPSSAPSPAGVTGINVAEPGVGDAYGMYAHRLNNDSRVLERPEKATLEEIERALGVIPGKSTKLQFVAYKWIARALIPFCCGCGWSCYYLKRCHFEVPSASFALVRDEGGDRPRTRLYGPGYHVGSIFEHVERIFKFGSDDYVKSEMGDLHILTVKQGFISLFWYSGQPLLYGPGLHKITSPQTYERTVSLDRPYIEIGPEKWILLPDGYDAVVIDKGEVRVLPGGSMYHLSHKLINLAKLVPVQLQTDRVVKDVSGYLAHLRHHGGKMPQHENRGRGGQNPAFLLDTKTKDHTEVYLDSMLYWRICDTLLAARTVMQLMESEDSGKKTSIEEQLQVASRNIDYLRETVLRITKSKLTAAVGLMSVVDAHSLGAGLEKDAVVETSEELIQDKQKKKKKQKEDEAPLLLGAADQLVVDKKEEKRGGGNESGYAVLAFLNSQKKKIVIELNRDLDKYGVTCVDLAIFDALLPDDIQQQLNRQVRARVDQVTSLIEAETAQRVSHAEVETDRVRQLGLARNRLAKSEIEREEQSVRGEASAVYTIKVAEGNKTAAELESSVPLAQDIARIRAGGEAMAKFNSSNKSQATYFMGDPSAALGPMMMNLATNLAGAGSSKASGAAAPAGRP